jgi:hypothetical protein
MVQVRVWALAGCLVTDFVDGTGDVVVARDDSVLADSAQAGVDCALFSVVASNIGMNADSGHAGVCCARLIVITVHGTVHATDIRGTGADCAWVRAGTYSVNPIATGRCAYLVVALVGGVEAL